MTPSAEVLTEARLKALRRRFAEELRAGSLYISLSGLDGSGKSTLARELCRAMTAAGLQCRVRHVFEWYKNLKIVPYRMISGRARGEVVIFDRCIYDNLVVLFARGAAPRWLVQLVARLVRLLYPRFDHRFFLYAPYEVITTRRPEISIRHYEAMLDRYHTVTAVADYRRMVSTPALLDQVLEMLETA